jgi:hypothetical protein
MDKILSLSSIRKRKAALEAEMAELEFRVSEISDSIDELDEAEAFVKRFGDENQDGEVAVEEPDSKLPFPPAIRAKTTKDALLLALKVSTEPWLTANELQVRAIGLKGEDIPMATVSPTLSNLKNAGLIIREGHKVALVTRIRSEESKRDVGEGRDELVGSGLSITRPS